MDPQGSRGFLSDAKGDPESAAAAKAVLICCISIDRSYAVKKCAPYDNDDTKLEYYVQIFVKLLERMIIIGKVMALHSSN